MGKERGKYQNIQMEIRQKIEYTSVHSLIHELILLKLFFSPHSSSVLKKSLA